MLLDPMFVVGVVAGLIVLALGLFGWAARGGDEVQRFGGVLVAVALVIVLVQSQVLSVSQILGIALLAIAGLLHRSIFLGALLAIAGAFFVIRPEAAESPVWVAWFALVAIVLAAPLVAAFDQSYWRTGLPLPLFGIAALGVFLTVPDTEGAFLMLGVAGVAGFLGWPRPFASLGGAGSYAAVGVYVLVAAEGAGGRPASIVASVAVLGLLVILPVATGLRSTGWAAALNRVNAFMPLVVQLVLIVLISRTAGRIVDVMGASLLTLALVTAAATIILVIEPPRPSHLPD